MHVGKERGPEPTVFCFHESHILGFPYQSHQPPAGPHPLYLLISSPVFLSFLLSRYSSLYLEWPLLIPTSSTLPCFLQISAQMSQIRGDFSDHPIQKRALCPSLSLSIPLTLLYASLLFFHSNNHYMAIHI